MKFTHTEGHNKLELSFPCWKLIKRWDYIYGLHILHVLLHVTVNQATSAQWQSNMRSAGDYQYSTAPHLTKLTKQENPPSIFSINNMEQSQLKNKNQIDANCCFIIIMIGSTCFGHCYAHHQELATVRVVLITTWAVRFLGCCWLEVRYRQVGWVSGLQTMASVIALIKHANYIFTPRCKAFLGSRSSRRCAPNIVERVEQVLALRMIHECSINNRIFERH